MKKILYLMICMFTIFCLTGCGSEETKINKNSQLVSFKEIMVNDLNNYSYDVSITVNTGIIPVSTTMNCKDDRKNQISYCYTSTYGVETEEYIDYKNKISYSKVTTLYGGDSSNGKWISTKYNGGDTNAWLNLNDYIFNLKEESKDGGTYYTGTIDSTKLGNAISQTTDTDTSEIVSEDIDISVFVNSSNYIEKMSFTIEVMGIEEVVEINYKNYNNSGDIIIPEEER